MRQWWLAVAVLVTLAAKAHADRITCACPADIMRPNYAMAVPTNSKTWHIGRYGAVHYSTRVPAAQLLGVTISPLALDHATTGQRDDTPPGQPTNVHVSLVAGPGDHLLDISSLSAFGAFDLDTELVRIDIHDELGIVSLLTTPDRLHLCSPGFFVYSSTVRVDVRAIDLAGNESAPFSTMIDVVRDGDRVRQCDRHGDAFEDRYDHAHYHHGHGFGLLLLVLAYPAFLVGWLVVTLVRRASVNRELAEPVSLLEAEVVTRRLLRWQVIWSALLLVTTLAIVAYVDDDYWIVIAPWLFSTFGKLYLQRRALRLLDRPETDAVRRGRWLVVTALQDSATIRAADIDFVMAKKRAVPTSVVQ